MRKIHLITTCSKSKNAKALESFRYSNLSNYYDVYRDWSKRIKAHFQENIYVTETQNLYRGAHWNTALKISKSRADISLWVISAGLGLRHGSDPAVPYEASFTGMSQNSAKLWELLVKNPILPGCSPSLEDLLQKNQTDSFVIAASPVYLRAVENDLLRGISSLPDPMTQITIVTTRGYRGGLQPYLRFGNKDMMGLLNSNMTTLNIKHAASIISSITAAI